MADTPPIDVLAVGSAIVDVLTPAADDFVAAHGLVKGTMALIDADAADRLYGEMGPGIEVSGGSAANTVAGVASLGNSAAFVGKVRDDQLGAVFTHDIRAAGVHFATPPAADGPGTARCLVLVTPDAQRTMSTYLGAAVGLSAADVDPAVVGRAQVTYLEGYLWDPPEAIDALRQAIAAAHQNGGKVAFSLSDPFCVSRHRDEFLDLVEAHVDILFGNEEEVSMLYKTDDLDVALDELRGLVDVAAVTRGAAGSVAVAGDETVSVPAEPVQAVVDTTGAGDLYAAGFLVGLVRGVPLVQCARLGGLAAAEVISHVGARPQQPLDALARRAGLL
ncbi:MAG TPA: adenosine kinase [Acidimicrobiales bacterium]|nr:adenosine kinase [Acidimicrobiales bacterium]